MKKLLISLLFITNLFAFNAEVKKADVKLQVNDNTVEYKKGDTFNLNGGDIICFVDGKGRVIIKGDSYKKQLSKRSKLCKKLPLSKESSINYVAQIQSKIVNVLASAQEEEVDGVSRKSVDNSSTIGKDIVVDSKKKFIVIESENWGPLPVTLAVYDKNNNRIEESVNEEDVETSFIIPSSVITRDGGSRIEVLNAFGDQLLNSKVQIKK